MNLMDAVFQLTNYVIPTKKVVKQDDGKLADDLPKKASRSFYKSLKQMESLIEFMEYVENEKPDIYDEVEDCFISFMDDTLAKKIKLF
jgi:hypothetical protein